MFSLNTKTYKADADIKDYMCHLLQSIMRNPKPGCDIDSTVKDWNRNGGVDFKVSADTFQKAEDTDLTIDELAEWLMPKFTDTKLFHFVTCFANQACWFSPESIFKRACLEAGDFVLSCDQNRKIAPSSKDRLTIIPLESKDALQVNLIRYYFTYGEASTGKITSLKKPIVLNIKFTVHVKDVTVADFSLEVTYASELKLLAFGEILKNYIDKKIAHSS